MEEHVNFFLFKIREYFSGQIKAQKKFNLTLKTGRKIHLKKHKYNALFKCIF